MCWAQFALMGGLRRIRIVLDVATMLLMFVSLFSMLSLLASDAMAHRSIQFAVAETMTDFANISKGKDIASIQVTRMAGQVLAQLISYGAMILIGTIKLAICNTHTAREIIIEKKVVCENQSNHRTKANLVQKNTHTANFNINATRLIS